MEPVENVQSDKAGLSPGTLVHVGEKHESEVRITLLNFNEKIFDKQIIHNLEEISKIENKYNVTWINIEGLHDVKLIDAVGKKFNIHPLVLEDILNTNQRTKIEEYEDYIFIVFKGITTNGKSSSIEIEQIGILLLDRCLITFKERRDDLFKTLEMRLENNKGHLRKNNADYLAYAAIDTIVDQYFIFQDMLDNTVEPIEDELLEEPSHEILSKIQQIKKQIISVKQCVSPLRDVLTILQRSDSNLINDNTKIYFRDVYDHSLRVLESIDIYRELIGNMLEIYLTKVSNKMNETMKVLTVFASIFIPLTFIAGIYGMNFKHMPELYWKWSYPVLWSVFILIPILLLIYFKRKNWL